jgi:hypothetical protein
MPKTFSHYWPYLLKFGQVWLYHSHYRSKSEADKQASELPGQTHIVKLDNFFILYTKSPE